MPPPRAAELDPVCAAAPVGDALIITSSAPGTARGGGASPTLLSTIGSFSTPARGAIVSERVKTTKPFFSARIVYVPAARPANVKAPSAPVTALAIVARPRCSVTLTPAIGASVVSTMDPVSVTLVAGAAPTTGAVARNATSEA